jgi:hypothetical protein
MAKAKASTETSKLAQMRLMLQAQQAPAFNFRPVDSIGEGVGQGAEMIYQSAAQQQQQKMLQNMLEQQQKAELLAEQERQESFEPLQGLTGLPSATMSNMDASVLNTMLQDGLKKSDAIAKAQNLQEQFGRVQPGINDPNFLNLSPDNGYNMSGEQAALIAGNPAAAQGIAEAVAAPQRVQMLQDSLDALVPDRSTMNGQKAYRNTYQELFGNAPVTDVQMQQEQATLQNALLGNQGQAITNAYMPMEKNLGIINSRLTAQSKGIDNSWKPILNQAGLDAITTRTAGDSLNNLKELRRQDLELQTQEIIADPTLTTETKMGLLAQYQQNPDQFIGYLDRFSKKGGVAGVKGTELLKFIAENNKNANKPPAPTGTPAPAQPAPQKSVSKPPATPFYISGDQKKPVQPKIRTLGDALGYGINVFGRMLQPDPNAPIFQDMKRANQQTVAPAQPTVAPAQPKKPQTIAEAVQKKQVSRALAGAADQRIQQNQGALNANNQQVQQATSLLQTMQQAEERRKQEYDRAFGRGKW